MSAEELAAELGTKLIAQERSVAVAESLTGGLVSSALAQVQGASSFFRGGVVAYASDVKHCLLRVPPGPVVSAIAACQMASSVRVLLEADVAVALTGAGGPDGQDDQPPGTVFIAVATAEGDTVRRLSLEGSPEEVCRGACEQALRLLLQHS